MELAVNGIAFVVDELEGVGTIAIHVSVAVWSPSVREQEGHLVGRLRPQTNEIPEHVAILKCSGHMMVRY